jgi:hypothetical protein
VWSLKADDGMEPPPADVVAVESADLVELQATLPSPTSPTMPSAAMRIFHVDVVNVPPWSRFEQSRLRPTAEVLQPES